MTASELDAALHRDFGFSAFRPYKRAIVEDLVAGCDASEKNGVRFIYHSQDPN
jgi:ectoine hydroxylase-related dioxygenase (phytanoyl-CoA dioxygenase family)